jgi:site-specific recombinase XerD
LASEPTQPAIFTRKDRRGFWASLWIPGKGSVQRKLGDDLAAAKARLAQLVEKHTPPATPTDAGECRCESHVFLNAEGTPWSKGALSNRMQRTRRRAGLPPEVALYRLRHAFAVEGVRRRIHLKVLAEAMGHRGTAMIDRWYANISEDIPLLLEATKTMFSNGRAQQ